MKYFRTKDLGFIGRTLTVTTLSLNKNNFQDYKTTLNVSSKMQSHKRAKTKG